VFLSRVALGVLAAYRRAAVRAGARLGLAPELHEAVCAALHRGESPGPFETAASARACFGQRPVAEDGPAPYPNVSDVQRTFGVTWGELVEREPPLAVLLGRARLAGAGCQTLADVDRVFGPLRNELAALIGFAGKHHSHPVLGSAGAYEVAYWNLYHAVVGPLCGRAGGREEALDKERW
jgi:hypothetical protein